ncbi:MAG: 30S ribosomal protein S12 methylthiotransferase RimO [Erysipelotrichaceae bacterium]|nr:30S ribosomal protein S12 methylthiotransferase RimO [Erysipelotrichaceae bacterium]
MKVGFISLGCSKNLVDSEHIIAMFDNPAFEMESNPAKCDVIVINTCGFILSAKEEAIDTILEMAEFKKTGVLKKLIVCGCFVQRYFDDCVQEFPEVDRFIRIDDYPRLPEILHELFDLQFKEDYGKNRKMITNSYTAYLRISDGCDNRCAYCAIPLIRGNCHSYPIEYLVEQAKLLYAKGVKELNIIAQDTTYYGHDLYGHFALKDLLAELDRIEFKWIRILYMYPDEIDDELLETMRSCKRVLPYFDIPVQYGNDRILKLMNRRGSVKLIEERVRKIRSMFDGAIIRTTLIVGFPSETRDTFEDTLEMVKKLEFDSLGAFTYSKEEDTAAYKMSDEVDEEVKQQRYEELMLLQQEIVEKKLQDYVGKRFEVLVERHEDIFGRYIGRSYMSAPDGVDGVVYIKSDDLKIGEFVQVEITGYKDYDLIAKVVE